MSDEVDQVLSNIVHVASIVFQSSCGCQGWSKATAEKVPGLAILINHTNIVVILGSQVSVDNISLIWRAQRIF